MTSKQVPQTHKIKLMSLSVILGDSYRLWFFVTTYFILFFIYWFVGGPIGTAAITGSVAGTFGSLWLGMPSRMQIPNHRDLLIVEEYLEKKSYQRNGDEWAPALPRPFYFNSQKVRIRDHEVQGPIMTLQKLQRLLDIS
jgi:hypothetical protein